jgi:hypothetical protein
LGGRPGLEADHSPSSSAAVKIKLNCTFTPPYAVMACMRTLSFLYFISARKSCLANGKRAHH